MPRPFPSIAIKYDGEKAGGAKKWKPKEEKGKCSDWNSLEQIERSLDDRSAIGEKFEGKREECHQIRSGDTCCE